MTTPNALPTADDCLQFQHGGLDIAALCDAIFEIDKELLVGAAPDAIDARFPAASTTAACTAYLVKMDGLIILVDAGAGDTFDGHVNEALAKTDIASEQIDLVLLTHLHLDHCGGLLRDDRPIFPNAEIWLAEAERDFWQDDAATGEIAKRLTPYLGDDFIPTHVKIARDTLAAYAGKVRVFSGNHEIIPGIRAVPLHGHTPGHSGYLFVSGENTFFAWGDVVHAAAVQFSLPEAGMIFDWDARMAVETRERILAEASANNWLAAGMHIPFPGAGIVARDNGAYRFIPIGEIDRK